MNTTLATMSTAFAGQFSNRFTLGCGVFTAIPAMEMAVRTIVDLGGWAVNGFQTDKHRENLGIDLGGTLFYGALAANIIPCSALFGAVFFTAYSAFKYSTSTEKSDYYFATRVLIGVPVEGISTLGKGGAIINKIFSFLGNLFKNAAEEHPIWIGVVVVGLAIGVYKGVPGMIKTAQAATVWAGRQRAAA